ncbi:hypothetical protein B0H17DRAFT_1138911 [Mycena rosella]|uniref:Uncharacterized protein n=1 Tax=Mycena rosella TaxID=1033263 RepID=A0AAD7GBT3_MYCRO|nr:hypothetical protein B0H17DRAFT_1138911 [Mycena rosella]
MQKKIFLPLLSAVSATTAAALVTNGGFETGAASPWVIGGGGSAHVASNSDSMPFLPVAAHSGTHFLTISREKADEPASELSNDGLSAPTTISQEVTVVAGTTYHFSASYAAFDQPLDGCLASAAVGITFVASATLFASQSGNGITVPPYFALNGTYVAPAGSTGQQSLVGNSHFLKYLERLSRHPLHFKTLQSTPTPPVVEFLTTNHPSDGQNICVAQVFGRATWAREDDVNVWSRPPPTSEVCRTSSDEIYYLPTGLSERHV